jgi:hypothetical protein
MTKHTYNVSAWASGGWDINRAVTSLKAAMAEKRDLEGAHSNSSSNRIQIERDGVVIACWHSDNDGNFFRVCI